MATSFQLNSTQTAFAIIPPTPLTTSIQKLRSVHDKAYLKWPPHFNVLYPSVSSAQLSAAIRLLREGLAQESFEGPLNLSVEEVGSFSHRKNATVFLKLNTESEDHVKRLRQHLCNALGRDKSEGTIDGEFRPHLTIGQAGLQGNAVNRLKEQAAECLEGLHWSCTQLAILKRNSAGNMDIVDTISFERMIQEQGVSGKVAEYKYRVSGPPGWDNCFELDNDKWSICSAQPLQKQNQELLIATFNVMTEDFAPIFSKRLPLIEEELDSVFRGPGSAIKVLCLQEVDQNMLPLLLSSRMIQKHFSFCSHSDQSILPSIRNKIIFSSTPFRHFNLQFPERHKSALFAKLLDMELTVVNVHLTSSLTNESVQVKKRQMDIVTDFLMQNKMLKSTILAGDFNTTTSSSTVQTAIDKKIITHDTAELLPFVIHIGRWKDAFVEFDDGSTDYMEETLFPGEEGATFDRINNPLAAAKVSPIDSRPQRYDRILFYNGAAINVDDFGYFAKPQEDDENRRISDHYGIFALLRHMSQSNSIPTQPPSKVVELETVSIIEDDFDVKPLLEPFMPNSGDQIQRETALSELQVALKESFGDVIVAPLGSYALDTHFADSDIDVLVIGSVDSSTFFAHSSWTLRLESDNASHAIIINSLVRILEITINGIKIDVQYCYAPALVAKHLSEPASLDQLIFDSSLVSSLNPVSLRPLNTLRDTVYLRNTIPYFSSFKTAHRFLSIYLRRHGLYSAKFGYLGGIHLTLMLNRVMKLMAAQAPDMSPVAMTFSPATIIRTFFNYFAKFSWAKNSVEDPEFRQPSGMPYPSRAGTKEPVVIRALHLPTARPNVAESCTIMSAQTLTSCFRAAAGKLLMASNHYKEAAWKWCLRSVEASVSDFLNLRLDSNSSNSNQGGCFVKIRLEMWDLKQQDGNEVRQFVGGIESMMPGLFVGLGKVSGSEGTLSARVWPARFWIPETSSADDDERGSSLVGYYLVGVTTKSEDTENADDLLFTDISLTEYVDAKDDQKKKKPHNLGGAMSNVLISKVIIAARDHERSLSSLRAVKDTSSWVEVDVVERKKVWDMGLNLDSRDWTGFAGTHLRQRLQTQNSTIDDELSIASAIGTSALPNRNRAKFQASAETTSTIKKPLRPIQDILSRIQWDPTYNAEEFVIGFEDRFDGIKEMPLTSWKSETTDEEFIPLHRIVWVRKRGGEKVWDRRVRYDGVFGSGIVQHR